MRWPDGVVGVALFVAGYVVGALRHRRNGWRRFVLVVEQPNDRRDGSSVPTDSQPPESMP